MAFKVKTAGLCTSNIQVVTSRTRNGIYW